MVIQSAVYNLVFLVKASSLDMPSEPGILEVLRFDIKNARDQKYGQNWGGAYGAWAYMDVTF